MGDFLGIEKVQSQELGMKWYKFLIYFGLWAAAVITFIDSLLIFSGVQYANAGLSIVEVYNKLPELESVDCLFGLFGFAISLYIIVVRYSLTYCYKISPILLCLIYVINGVHSILYSIIFASIVGASDFGGEIGRTIVFTAIMVIINYKYFSKRKHIFIN